MYQYKAKCVNVVDGDTMDFDVDLGFYLTKRIRVRLATIDTPEIYGKDNDKVLGNKVKQFVIDNLFHLNADGTKALKDMPLEVVVATEKTGSFGRWIGTVTFPAGQTLADKIRAQFPEIK